MGTWEQSYCYYASLGLWSLPHYCDTNAVLISECKCRKDKRGFLQNERPHFFRLVLWFSREDICSWVFSPIITGRMKDNESFDHVWSLIPISASMQSFGSVLFRYFMVFQYKPAMSIDVPSPTDPENPFVHPIHTCLNHPSSITG